MNRRRVASLVSAGLIITASLFTTVPASGKDHLDVLLDGLASPKGIAAGDHSVFVAQGWFSQPGPVLEYLLTGRDRGTAREVTPPLLVTDITGTPDGAGWAIVWDGAEAVDLVRQATETSAPETILDIIGYQADDDDPDDQDGFAEESNPNSLAGLSTNEVLVADAAGNDLLRVNADHTAVTVARWPRENLETNPSLPAIMAEAVPTTVTIGPDGWAYVGQLIGFPGTPGTAHIWRVNPFSENEVCSVDPAMATDGCTVWKSGFTSIFDIAFNPHNGTLYVYEIAKDGWLAFEAGFGNGGDFPPAVLLEVKGKKIQELVPGQLSEPGGVAVGWDGSVFVTDGAIDLFETHGRLIRIRGN